MSGVFSYEANILPCLALPCLALPCLALLVATLMAPAGSFADAPANAKAPPSATSKTPPTTTCKPTTDCSNCPKTPWIFVCPGGLIRYCKVPKQSQAALVGFTCTDDGSGTLSCEKSVPKITTCPAS